jgi:hypothetical protein
MQQLPQFLLAPDLSGANELEDGVLALALAEGHREGSGWSRECSTARKSEEARR